MGAQCQCYLFDRKLLELERTPRISVISHRQRSMGNKTSTRYVTPSRLLQTIRTLARRTRRTHSGLGHESRARPRNIYLLGTNLGSRKAFRFSKSRFAPKPPRCWFTNVTSVWRNKKKKLAVIPNLKKRYFPALLPTDTTPYKSWLYKSTPITVLSGITYPVSSPRLPLRDTRRIEIAHRRSS